MYVIDVEFIPIFEVSVGECLKEKGVYVLWSMNALRRPSYIGEGDVLPRILAHLRSEEKPFGTGLDGVIGLLVGGNLKKNKTDAEIVEHTLLEAADRIDAFPPHNSHPGKLASVYKRGTQHDTIRLNFRGNHPLRWGSKLHGRAELTWRWDCELDAWDLSDMPWRRS